LTLTRGGTGIQRVVITRSRKGNIELATELRRRGFIPVSVDTISFLPPKNLPSLDACLKDLHSYHWVVFTSATGVGFFARRMKKLSLEMPWKGPPSVAAVGAGTGRALSNLGIETDFMPSSYLTRKLADELPYKQGQRVLLLRSDIADPVMPERMKRRGFEVTESPIYRTRYGDGGVDRRLDDADLIVFLSPSSVEGFCKKVNVSELEDLRSKRVACIGPVTATAAREHGFKRIISPKSHTVDSLVRQIVRLNQDG
jgi:uroporphyrinogen III methyltransferase/synthase